MTYFTIRQIRKANEAAGHHFFQPEAMRFFASRVSAEVIGGHYFVTSEQFIFRGTKKERRYTLRTINAEGHINTIGEFQAYATRRAAIAAAHRLAALENGKEPGL